MTRQLQQILNMKALENRAWYVLFSFTISALITLGIWKASELPLITTAGAVFMFATLGVFQAANKLLALVLIKIKPSLGEIR